MEVAALCCYSFRHLVLLEVQTLNHLFILRTLINCHRYFLVIMGCLKTQMKYSYNLSFTSWDEDYIKRTKCTKMNLSLMANAIK